MTKKIFFSMIYVAIVTLISSILIMFIFVSDFEYKIDKSYIKNQAEYISEGIKNSNIDIVEYLEKLKYYDTRITLIDSGGNVLFDSDMDISAMENHSDRQEFIQALEKGFGESSRYSNTLSKKTDNYAIKLHDGSVLRVSMTSQSVTSLFLSMYKEIIFVFIMSLIIVVALSFQTSWNIIKPLNNVDLENPEEAIIYDELAPFLKRILQQKKQIYEQIDEMQKKQKEFEAIIENMREGILILNTKSEIIAYNNSALKYLKIDDINKNNNIYILNHNYNLINGIQKSLNGEYNEFTIEYDKKVCQVLINPVIKNNLIEGIVVILFDITEKVERERLRREFTANVSHELKTPLTVISGLAEIIKAGIVKPDDIVHFADNIYNEAQSLIAMIQNIIKLSQLDDIQNYEEWKNVDLQLVIKNVINRLEFQAKQKNISFCVNLTESIINGIPSLINEIIYNLCDNAIRYNNEYGKIFISINDDENYIYVNIKDTGIGIPISEQERIFERFYRVNESRSRNVEGTGLGLSIVKHSMSLHNAKIDINSEFGKGTEVILTFNK